MMINANNPYLKQVKRLIFKQNVYFFILAFCSGLIGAISVQLLNIMSLTLHKFLFHLDGNGHLSGLSYVNPWYCICIPLIGAIGLFLVRYNMGQFFSAKIADIIEANALYGGKLSVKDSFYLTLQTLLSNGFGISLGLESAYTQVSAAAASKIGRFFKIRQNKLRILVGCGAAGAIGAAFNSILGGAFYGFEIVLASYNFINFPYIMIAAMSGYIMIHCLGGAGPVFHIVPDSIHYIDYGIVCIFSLICAIIAIMVMYGATRIEIYINQLRIPKIYGLVAGALMVGGMGILTPAVLGSGHGFLWVVLDHGIAFKLAVFILFLKAIASSVSLGVGFRGGLFFASMMLGGTAGIVYGNIVLYLGIHTFSPLVYAAIGMAVMSASIIGGPLSMMFLSLDMTQSYSMTSVIILAVIVAIVTVRKIFGYSFATWRFHLSGKKIRSALDISGLTRTTAQTLMKPVDFTLDYNLPLNQVIHSLQFHHKELLILKNEENEYAGLVELKDIFENLVHYQEQIGELAIRKNRVLTPGMNIKEMMDGFDDIHECPWLIVVRGTDNYEIMGIVNEDDVLNRYNEILERQIKDLTGMKLYREL